MKFAQNGEKNLGIVTPLQSFFSIYCSKKIFVRPQKVTFWETSSVKQWPSQIFATTRRIFLRQFYPKTMENFVFSIPFSVVSTIFLNFFVIVRKNVDISSRDVDSNPIGNYRIFHFQGYSFEKIFKYFDIFAKWWKKIWPSKAGTKQKFQFGSEFL